MNGSAEASIFISSWHAQTWSCESSPEELPEFADQVALMGGPNARHCSLSSIEAHHNAFSKMQMKHSSLLVAPCNLTKQNLLFVFVYFVYTYIIFQLDMSFEVFCMQMRLPISPLSDEVSRNFSNYVINFPSKYLAYCVYKIMFYFPKRNIENKNSHRMWMLAHCPERMSSRTGTRFCWKFNWLHRTIMLC